MQTLIALQVERGEGRGGLYCSAEEYHFENFSQFFLSHKFLSLILLVLCSNRGHCYQMDMLPLFFSVKLKYRPVRRNYQGWCFVTAVENTLFG